ncbi:MAG: anhydro-N-acetylmuramic acid kinase [candidate division Zixibacteria bacterium]|nr:anhydro-N-acetylmuramic acid kinase [candidate division Zixibacteria bacterium]
MLPRRPRVIGINSGTSLDGLDVALFEFTRNKRRYRPVFLDGVSYRFPQRLRHSLYMLANGEIGEIRGMMKADKSLAEFIALKTLQALKSFGVDARDIALVASHGQTISHIPEEKLTLQIGDPSIIAARAGITVVGDFRMADTGAGGEGAPLSPVMHYHIFSGSQPAGVLNIGGISNISYIPGRESDEIPFGFDCGPGNMLIDALSGELFGKAYDSGGRVASRGKVDGRVLDELLKDEFIRKKPPKSTGREYYGTEFIERYFRGISSRESVLTTAVEFTVRSISINIESFIPPIEKVVVCGGGAKNDFLMRRLAYHLPMLKIVTSGEMGIPPQFVECAGFAVLGILAVNRIKVDLRKTTGAGKRVVLGKVCYA